MANLSYLPEQWRNSGLTQREFCDRKGISVATFSYWRGKELRGEIPKSPIAKPSFTEVVVEQPTAEQVIEISFSNGTTVRIPMPIGC